MDVWRRRRESRGQRWRKEGRDEAKRKEGRTEREEGMSLGRGKTGLREEGMKLRRRRARQRGRKG